MDSPTSIFRTPLGELFIDLDSFWHHEEDPLAWHLDYWLNIGVIGMVLGEDPLLMNARIDMEHHKIRDRELRDQISNAWTAYTLANGYQYRTYWEGQTLEDDVGQAYLRDIARMLEDRKNKMRDSLRGHGTFMNKLLQMGDVMGATETSYIISEIHSKLQQDEVRQAEAIKELQTSLNGGS